jgi:hypothetical protein
MVVDLPQLTMNLRQFQVRESHYEQIIHEIVEEERPAMQEIEEYQEKFFHLQH